MPLAERSGTLSLCRSALCHNVKGHGGRDTQRKGHGVRLHEEAWSTSADLSIADESVCRSAHTVDSHALSQQLGVELLEVVVMIPPNIMGELMHERFSNPLIVSEALQ